MRPTRKQSPRAQLKGPDKAEIGFVKGSLKGSIRVLPKVLQYRGLISVIGFRRFMAAPCSKKISIWEP